MLCGIGTDIVEVGRLKKWVETPGMCGRFFAAPELQETGTVRSRCQHYAARFAAKEAFSKALGTGLLFDLKDVYVTKDAEGKPLLTVTGRAHALLRQRCGDCAVHVSLSHEKEYAVAFVVIERRE